MKKKVLFISTVSSVFHLPLLKALKAFGFEVEWIDFRGDPILDTENPIHRAAHRLPAGIKKYLYDRAHAEIDRKILAKAQTFKPDYFFVTKAKFISLATLDAMRKIAPTINWYTDMMSNWVTIKKIIGHYDFLFNYDRYVIDLLHKEGHPNAYHLPWCGYLEKDAKWPDKKSYKYNLVFIGSYHPEIFPREAELKELMDLGLKVWGPGWGKSALKDCWQGIIPPVAEKVQAVYQESKMAIYYDSLYDVPGTGITLRPFEITAAGTMMLGNTFRSEFPELFAFGTETIVFKDVEDLRTKVQYYLDHEEERRAIAKAGFERTRNTHTYHDRIRQIFSIVDKTR